MDYLDVSFNIMLSFLNGLYHISKLQKWETKAPRLIPKSTSLHQLHNYSGNSYPTKVKELAQTNTKIRQWNNEVNSSWANLFLCQHGSDADSDHNPIPCELRRCLTIPSTEPKNKVSIFQFTDPNEKPKRRWEREREIDLEKEAVAVV